MMMAPALWMMMLIYFLLNYAAYGLSFWLPTFISELGIAESHAGRASGRASQPLRHDRRGAVRDQRRPQPRTALAPDRHVPDRRGGLFPVPACGRSVTLTMAGFCLAAICTQAFPSLFWALPNRIWKGVANAAGIAGINAVGNLAGTLSPSIIGIMRTRLGQADIAIFSLGAALVVATVLVHLLPKMLIDDYGQRTHENDQRADPGQTASP